MFINFSAFIILSKCLFAELFLNANSSFKLAGKNLLFASFRIKTTDWYSWKVYFRNFFKIFLLLRNDTLKFTKRNDSKTWMYDNSPQSCDLRLEFIANFSNSQIGGCVFKSDLIFSENLFRYIVNCSYCFFVALALLPVLIFKKNKGSVGLVFFEFFEIVNLVKILKENQVTDIYYFCIYEKDSNLTYLILNFYGIRVKKITSEVPLVIWNKIILTDDLILCSAYQQEEVVRFKSTIKVDKISEWGPESVTKSQMCYPPKKYNTELSIGFYSTGNWLRSIKNEMLDNENVLQDENALKKYLAEYTQNKKDIILKIFLHPKEKHPDYFELTKLHYQEYFSDTQYEFANLNDSTSRTLNDCNLAIALYSTIVLERLYFGFKILIMPISYENFPINSSGLYNISAFSKNELFQKIDESLPLSNKDFFIKYKLQNYTKYLS